MHKGPGFYRQEKAKEKLCSDDKKDEDNGLQITRISDLNINKDLDHLVNSLEKDTKIKRNETKIKSEKFAPDTDTNIGKKKKRTYQKWKVKLDFTRSQKKKM